MHTFHLKNQRIQISLLIPPMMMKPQKTKKRTIQTRLHSC